MGSILVVAEDSAFPPMVVYGSLAEMRVAGHFDSLDLVAWGLVLFRTLIRFESASTLADGHLITLQ